MRRIAQSEDHAHLDRFQAFLEQEGLESILIEEIDGWALWVDDENKVKHARDWYEEFRQDPFAERYRHARVARDARRTAIKLAAEEAEAETLRQQQTASSGRGLLPRIRRAQSFPVRRGFTIGLIAMSLFGAMLVDFNLTSPAGRWMAFCATPRTTTGLDTLSQIFAGECWRLLSPAFLYFDFRHLVFGVIFLYHFGIRIESLRGPIVLGSLCLGAAIVTNVAQAIAPVDVAIPGLAGGAVFGGMSGVVFTLFAFIWMQSIRFPKDFLRVDNITILVMLVWQAICIATPEWGFANVGHLAGLCFGAAIGWLYTPKQPGVLAAAGDAATVEASADSANEDQ